MNTVLCRFDLKTPFGKLLGIGSPSALVALEFAAPDRLSLLAARFARFFDAPTLTAQRAAPDDAIYVATQSWLDRYFGGEPVTVADAPPLDARGTPFELRVWELLKTIPIGLCMTYGELARRLGNPDGARAVGGASRRNPIGLIIPCHRVIGSGGNLTGYGGGLEKKEWLLAHEARWKRESAAPLLSC